MPAVPYARSDLSAAWTASTESPGRQLSRAATRSAVGSAPVTIPASCARWPPATSARPTPTRRPSAVITARVPEPSTSTSATGAEQTTRPPWSSMSRTSASGSAWLPPTGVVQPKSTRPADKDDGRKPVPGRRGSWMVAIAIQSTNDRTTGCSKVSCTTSQALRSRELQVRAGDPVARLREVRAPPPVGRCEPAAPGLDHRAERRCVAVGPTGELGARRVEVGVHDQHVATGLREDHRGIGGEVAQAVVGDQAELVVADQGVVLDQHVRAAARVVREARKGQLLGAGVPADGRPGLEHQDLEPGLGQVRRADQRVVAGADHHDLGALRQIGPGHRHPSSPQVGRTPQPFARAGPEPTDLTVGARALGQRFAARCLTRVVPVTRLAQPQSIAALIEEEACPTSPSATAGRPWPSSE